MEYTIISGDGHIDLRWLPHDLFVAHAPAQWKDQVPHVRDTPTGQHWFAEGRDLTTRPFGTLANTEPPKRGESQHVDRMYAAGFYDGQAHPTTPVLRLKDQEIDGIEAEVMYGILGISRLLESRELLHVVDECTTPGQRSSARRTLHALWPSPVSPTMIRPWPQQSCAAPPSSASKAPILRSPRR